MFLTKLRILPWLLIFLNCVCVAMTDEEPNQYSLTITDANHHLAEVKANFSAVKTKSFDVQLPVWRTGNYEILDLAKNIRNFAAFDANDNKLAWHKVNKSTWRILLNQLTAITVHYQVYANQLRKRVSHIDASHAFLDASGVFVYSEAQRQKPIRIELNVPSDWRSVSGMQAIGQHQFVADNYDVLVDSPIESGLHYFDAFQVENQLYEIVIWGQANFDGEKLKADIEKLHVQAKKIYKSFPFTRYVFIFHAGDKLRGATEHLNSTVIQLDRFGFAPEKKYQKLLGIVAHEFVHTWNVKSYRPAGISPYHYAAENYSDLFWIAEGSTSYYDQLLPLRAGIIDTKIFFEYIAKDITDYLSKPGREVMSLSESSFDTWMKNDANRVHNSTVSIYLKGSIVSWLLDKTIRKLTNNNKSLDDMHYQLYQNYANNKSGYNSNQVREVLKQLTGNDFAQFWADYVDGTKAIDFDELLEFYGLKFSIASDNLSVASLNAQFTEQYSLAKVTIVDANGAAWHAGITTDDVLVALDGLQLTYADIQQRIENLKVGQTYRLDYFNQGVLKHTDITPVAATVKRVVVRNDKANKQQKKIFNSWSRAGGFKFL